MSHSPVASKFSSLLVPKITAVTLLRLQATAIWAIFTPFSKASSLALRRSKHPPDEGGCVLTLLTVVRLPQTLHHPCKLQPSWGRLHSRVFLRGFGNLWVCCSARVGSIPRPSERISCQGAPRDASDAKVLNDLSRAVSQLIEVQNFTRGGLTLRSGSTSRSPYLYSRLL